MFQPACKIQKYLKVVTYGESGTEVLFALQAPGRKVVIDTEGHTDLLGKKFDFDVLKTKLFSDVMKAVDRIEKDPQYDVLIIDSITSIYTTLRNAALKSAERRARSKYKDEEEAILTRRDWYSIKLKYQTLLSRLRNLPCHVVVTGWLSDVYEEGEYPKRIGVRMEADHQKANHFADVMIRLEHDQGKFLGIIEKDLTFTFAKGEWVANISFSHFLQALDQEGKEANQRIQTEEEAAFLETRISAQTEQAIKELWLELDYKPQLLNLQLRKDYGVSLADLTEVQGREFAEKLNSYLKAEESESIDETETETQLQPPIEVEDSIAGEEVSSNEAESNEETQPLVSKRQVKKIYTLISNLGFKRDQAKAIVSGYFKRSITSMNQLTSDQGTAFITYLEETDLGELNQWIGGDVDVRESKPADSESKHNEPRHEQAS